MNTQRGPEGANPLGRGPLCATREGQEGAIQKVAPSVETPIKHTESAEEANVEFEPARARVETHTTGEEGDDDGDVARF